jgi:TonB family protein
MDALNARLVQAKLAAASAPEVTEGTLTRTKGLELDYPDEALRKNVQGWVELSYVITAEGKVTKVKVLNSSPTSTFDSAASRAVSRLHYKPTIQAGKPIAVSTKLRIAFRLSK